MAKTLTEQQARKFRQPLATKPGRLPQRHRDLIEQFIQEHGVTVLPPAGSDMPRKACAGVE